MKKRSAVSSAEAPSAKRAANSSAEKTAATPDDGATAVRLQSAWRGYSVRSAGVTAHARALADGRRAAAAAADEAALARRLRDDGSYRQVGRWCRQADVRGLAALDARLEALVGLACLKEYCAALRRDCLARAALGDAPLLRNVLVSGALGSGKKLAAGPPARPPARPSARVARPPPARCPP